MMRCFSFLLFLSLSCMGSGFAQQQPSIIPQPVRLQWGQGQFDIDKSVSIHFDPTQPELKRLANVLASHIQQISAIAISQNKPAPKKIVLMIKKIDTRSTEGYLLNVNADQIAITSSGPAGIFYGIQSLLQTLPPVRTHTALKVPAVKIYDEPRFTWRGLHLDVSRHFFPIPVIKEYIDLMSNYKLNTFHWHLVDDQGWRIEIKKYPKLTEVGAWRVNQNDKIWGSRPQAQPGEVPDYGGYYTQQEIREIVAYAKERHVNIVPEIEMPGHVASAIASYPELSCKQQPQLQMTGGNYTGMSSNYCAGNEKVYVFLQDVLSEVVALFPYTYVHIGGDEVDKNPWKQCARCQQKMKDEHLKNEEELQSYFITRMEKFLLSKKRKMVGWDEILEGGLAPEATVMSWRGEAGGIEAAKMNHDVVMSPGSPLYFDHYQAGPEGEPAAFGGFNPLKKVYAYNPIPAALPADKHHHVLGAQGNVWTEMISTTSHLEYMILPRMLALSEVVWSPLEKKDWTDFSKRLKYHFNAFDQKGYNYSKGNFTVDIVPFTANGKLQVELLSESSEVDIHYTTDGSVPNGFSPRYQKPIEISTSQNLRAVAVKNGNVMNLKPAEQEFSIHKGVGGNIRYAHPPSNAYMAGGMSALIDGIKGKQAVGKFWHGFDSQDLIATLDLGQSKSVSRISLGCMQQYGSWIFLPTTVKFEVSTDGQQFREVGNITTDVPVSQGGHVTKEYTASFETSQVRYIRVTAKRLPVCPEGHPGAGKPAWLFADELVVQ